MWLEDPSGGNNAIPDIVLYPPIADQLPVVIGGWEIDGTIAYTVDVDEYSVLRPLGNLQDGSATLHLLPPGWQGLDQPKLENGYFYPLAFGPFDVCARHKFFDVPLNPVATGWGFRVELIGTSTDRDPSARAIGVYSDPECTQFLWTTGGFIQGVSDWQIDINGDPITVWYTDSWDGDRPEQKKDWNVAMLLGAAQEGHQTLGVNDFMINYLFWDYNQVGTWVDSGSTWLALIGANTFQCSDTAPFNVGQSIKIQETVMTITSIFTAGAPGILVVDLALPQFTIGDPIFI